MVVSSDLCPIQSSTVLTSKPDAASASRRWIEMSSNRSRRIKACSLGDGLTETQHVLLAIPGRRGEHENTSTRLPVTIENIGQTDRYGDLPLFPALREKAQVWLRSHRDGPQGQVHIGPTQLHHFLLTVHDLTHQAFRRTSSTHIQDYASVKDIQGHLRHTTPKRH
jgi:hypothetical protein